MSDKPAARQKGGVKTAQTLWVTAPGQGEGRPRREGTSALGEVPRRGPAVVGGAAARRDSRKGGGGAPLTGRSG